METGEKTGQCTILAQGRLAVDNRERIPPKWQRAINACRHQGGEGERLPLTRKRVPTARSQGPKGPQDMAACAPSPRPRDG